MQGADLEQHIGYMLKWAQHALRMHMADALRALGTTAAQYAALGVLAESPGLSGAELARRCFVTPQSMNAIVVSLEAAGLVARSPHPVHGRIIETSLTEAGRKLLDWGNRAVWEVERKMLDGLSTQDSAMLLDLLRRCTTNLEPERRQASHE